MATSCTIVFLQSTDIAAFIVFFFSLAFVYHWKMVKPLGCLSLATLALGWQTVHIDVSEKLCNLLGSKRNAILV